MFFDGFKVKIKILAQAQNVSKRFLNKIVMLQKLIGAKFDSSACSIIQADNIHVTNTKLARFTI